MDTNDPAAQGPQTGADGQGSETQVDPVEQVRNGMQKRIDELIAKNHERDSQVQALMAQQAQLLAAVTQRNEPVPAEPEVPEGMDPGMAKYMQGLLDRGQQPLLKQIEQLKTQIVPSAVQGQIAQVQAQLQQINNPAVTARVAALVQAYEKAGYLANGTATPVDALKIAMGEAAMGEFGQRTEQTNQRQVFNQLGGQPLTQGRNTGGQFTGQPKSLQINQVQNMGDLTQDQLTKLINEVEQNFPDGVDL